MGRYSIIYADPPWRYRVWNKKGKGRTAEHHYPTMPLQDICALDVKRIAEKNCALFLWATFPQIQEAFQVIKAWGFTYKTAAFVWVKRNRKTPSLFIGMGHWTRANAEVCLLATKGSPKRVSARVHQVIESPIRVHSRKPDETRERIVSLMGDASRIELFAREKMPGWDAWGDEIASDIGLTCRGPEEVRKLWNQITG
ncbi:MAG: DNA methyltransferase [Coriobacteriales bacterium]|jgi:N6-adenosine-specific RNA methylase IME4|nr:DNA methyltransferase [Coriobacteriales bacterium]